jgi:hypothetical protein
LIMIARSQDYTADHHMGLNNDIDIPSLQLIHNSLILFFINSLGHSYGGHIPGTWQGLLPLQRQWRHASQRCFALPIGRANNSSDSVEWLLSIAASASAAASGSDPDAISCCGGNLASASSAAFSCNCSGEPRPSSCTRSQHGVHNLRLVLCGEVDQDGCCPLLCDRIPRICCEVGENLSGIACTSSTEETCPSICTTSGGMAPAPAIVTAFSALFQDSRVSAPAGCKVLHASLAPAAAPQTRDGTTNDHGDRIPWIRCEVGENVGENDVAQFPVR